MRPARMRPDVCRAILLTSIFWVLLDVIVLFYYLDKSLLVSENFEKSGPGENGAGVTIDKAKEVEMKELFKQNQFNLMASNTISVNRSLPDYRSAKCKAAGETYKSLDLPSVSIIIVFHNEAFSTLLRTLHSVINRSPLKLLAEIIMIDDKSEREYLKKPLELYTKRFPIPVHLVHLQERSGLIRARLTGSAMAKGKVLLFLDAHVEVSEGWLEPLVERVFTDRKRVAAPIIDVISDETFEYVTASDTTWGGFNWHLNFRWYPVPDREMNRRNWDRSLPIQTPTIAGGLFAIDRQFFYDIGSYDEGMQVWGGENLEISFRVWMCGGSLEIHPCSRVGHVFRKQTPYTFPGGTATVIHHNAARTAEVWMDDYKAFFYAMVPAARNVDAGDVTLRRNLRSTLQCKSFTWYLENIYKEAPIPARYHSIGQIMNADTRKCIDTMGRKNSQPAGVSPCHGIGGNQAWSITANGEVRSDELCLASKTLSLGGEVQMDKCSTTSINTKHIFAYEPQLKFLIHKHTAQCLVVGSDGNTLQLVPCTESPENAKWEVQNYRAELPTDE
ncbi:glycosyl transferase family 2 domain-containing protein [Ditylenchus destructor]|nr:glycosyl transferase family 2 domain-containing protein [Ditylenchus destructor]